MTQNPSPDFAPQMNGGAGLSVLDDHIYQRLLRERIVFLGQEVDEQIANVIVAQLLYLEAEAAGVRSTGASLEVVDVATLLMQAVERRGADPA